MPNLTKEDVYAIRHATDICVHLNPRHPQGLVRLIKRRDYNKPFSEDQEHTLTATASVRLDSGIGVDMEYVECFAMRGIYHNQRGMVSTILKSLRVGDEIRFTFWPDAHSNGYVAMANLHADVLYLDVYRDGKHVAQWEFESSITPSNSARMVRGIPDTKEYKESAADARKNAA